MQKKKISSVKYSTRPQSADVASEPLLAYEAVSTYLPHMQNRLSIAHIANTGVSANVFFEVVDYTGYHREAIAELLDTSVKTFIRYKEEGKKLNPLSSEILLKITALFRKGREVFGLNDAFKRWLEKPAYIFNNHLPYELLKTSVGIDLLMDELTRIEYGDLA